MKLTSAFNGCFPEVYGGHGENGLSCFEFMYILHILGQISPCDGPN